MEFKFTEKVIVKSTESNILLNAQLLIHFVGLTSETRKSYCETARGIPPAAYVACPARVWTDTKTRVKTLPSPILRMRR